MSSIKVSSVSIPCPYVHARRDLEALLSRPGYAFKMMRVFGEGSGEALFAKRASPVTLQKAPHI
jgi:hypothetical protein